MMTPEDRYYSCKEYLDNALKFRSDIEDALCSLTPYGKEPDKDAPFVKEIFDRVDNLCDFIDEHCKQLDEEYSRYANEQHNLDINFDAWCYGLCPKLSRHFLFEAELKEIAKFKTHDTRSYEDTRQAIELWKASKNYREAV